MSEAVLDDHAKEVMRTLRAGDHFTLRGERGFFEAHAWEHPVEHEPWVRSWKLDHHGQRAGFSAIRVSRIDAVIPIGR